MRWLTLYLRSRRLAASLTALILCAGVLPLSLGDNWSKRYAILALSAAIAVAGVGLSGQDIDLDRIAALRWPPRRLAHLLLIGFAAAGTMLAAQALAAFTDPATEVTWTLRTTAGLLGLTALAATLFGGQFGWTLPLAWAMISLFTPETATPSPESLLAWPMAAINAPAAWWTAGALFATGTATYAMRGARR